VGIDDGWPAVGDVLQVFGYPEEGGAVQLTPARLAYRGTKGVRPTTYLDLASDTIKPGMSGAAVLNLRTGGVCGIVVASKHPAQPDGALAIPWSVIGREWSAVSRGLGEAPDANRSFHQQDMHWPRALDDGQIRAGDWPFAGPRLREYLKGAAAVAEKHPWVVPGISAPPLSAVYLRQKAEAEADDRYVPSRRPTSEAEELPADVVFEHSQSCVIVAGPGTGKSSLLNSGLARISRHWNDKPGGEVPVRVLAADMVGRSVPEAIARSVRDDMGAGRAASTWSAEFFSDEPVHGARWLVLVDGLDEIADRHARRKVVADLSALGRPGAESPYRFILASRPLSEGELPEGPGWAEQRYELLPFTRAQLVGFASTWFAVLGLGEPGLVASEFIAEIGRADLNDLARTPLMATMLCQLYALNPGAPLPRGRSGTYESFIKLLQDRQYAATSGNIYSQVNAALGRYGPSAISAAEQQLKRSEALVMQLATARRDGDSRPAGELLFAWTADDRPSHLPEELWRAFLEELMRRSSLLTERYDDFAFIHQTVGEFLAARQAIANPQARAAALHQVLGRWTRKRPWKHKTWEKAAEEDYSYIGFLLDACPDQELQAPVRRLIRRAGITGVDFLGSLADEGTVFDPALVDTITTSVARLAGRASGTETVLTAAFILVSFGDPRGLDLFASLADGSAAAAVPRRRHFSLDRSWRKTLRQMAQNEEEENRYFGCWQLAEHGDPRGADALAAFASDHPVTSDPSVQMGDLYREFAARDLAARDDPRGLELLAAIASDTGISDQVRGFAAESLVSFHDQRGDRVLSGLLADPKTGVHTRVNIAKNLAGRGDPAGIETLSTVIADPSSREDKRLEAVAALAIIDQQGPEMLATLADSPATPAPARREAAEALADLGDERAARLLSVIAAHPAIIEIDAKYVNMQKLRARVFRLRDPEEHEQHARKAADLSKEMQERFDAAVWLAQNGDPRAPDVLTAIAEDPSAGATLRRKAEVELAGYVPDTNRAALRRAKTIRYLRGPLED
jgi:hypothetical protein